MVPTILFNISIPLVIGYDVLVVLCALGTGWGARLGLTIIWVIAVVPLGDRPSLHDPHSLDSSSDRFIQ